MESSTYDGRVAPMLARRDGEGRFEVLAFKHPDAGLQIIKGALDAGEAPQDAARRTLAAEAGIAIDGKWLDMGQSKGIHRGQSWHFFLAPCPPLAATWTHETADDGHHTYNFFWQPLTEWFEGDWDERYIRAMRYVQARLEKMPAAQLATHCPQTRTNLADAIVSMVAERGAGKSICPSEVARQIGGSDEKVWRGLMKPIRAEALRLAAEGKVSVTRKGKPVDGPDFKGIYRIAPRA